MTNNEIKIRKATEKDYLSVNLLYLETDSLYSKNIPETYKKPPEQTLPRGNYLNMIEDRGVVRGRSLNEARFALRHGFS